MHENTMQRSLIKVNRATVEWNKMKNSHILTIFRLCHENLSPTRASGRTTGLAIMYIALAILNPDTEIPIYDHHDSTISYRGIANLVSEIILALGLENMILTRNREIYLLKCCKEKYEREQDREIEKIFDNAI